MTVKEEKYQDILRDISLLIEGETDEISIMATISCEIFHAFDYLNWVGFYRLVGKDTLKVGPYQGTHGCLTIALGKGVCGICASENEVQMENDVTKIPHHIACSCETKAEIVLPVRGAQGEVRAVFDLDSLEVDCFDEIDESYLKRICEFVYIKN